MTRIEQARRKQLRHGEKRAAIRRAIDDMVRDPEHKPATILSMVLDVVADDLLSLSGRHKAALQFQRTQERVARGFGLDT